MSVPVKLSAIVYTNHSRRCCEQRKQVGRLRYIPYHQSRKGTQQIPETKPLYLRQRCLLPAQRGASARLQARGRRGRQAGRPTEAMSGTSRGGHGRTRRSPIVFLLAASMLGGAVLAFVAGRGERVELSSIPLSDAPPTDTTYFRADRRPRPHDGGCLSGQKIRWIGNKATCC